MRWPAFALANTGAEAALSVRALEVAAPHERDEIADREENGQAL